MIQGIRNTIYFVAEKAADATAFAGVGFLTTYALNFAAKTYEVKTVLTEHLPIDLFDAAAFCGLFMLIDRVAKSILDFIFAGNDIERPSITLARRAASLLGAVAVVNQLPPEWALSALDLRIAALVVVSSLLVYSALDKAYRLFDKAHHSFDRLAGIRA